MITLRFSRQADIASDAIAWFSQGSFSHVDCLWEGGLLGARSDAVGGVAAGVFQRPFDYAKFCHRVDFNIPTTPRELLNWECFISQQVGKPYDREAILAFIIGRDWREDDSWICSELQAAAIEASGVVPKFYLAANKITPNSLALAVSAIPGVTYECLDPSAHV